jgi:hypothetical protein
MNGLRWSVLPLLFWLALLLAWVEVHATSAEDVDIECADASSLYTCLVRHRAP